MSTKRRTTSAWLLFVFLAVQAMPMLALGVTDVMVGMECCRKGKNAVCCKRKTMHTAPAFHAPRHCGLPCSGQPSHAAPAIAGPASPIIELAEPVSACSPIFLTSTEARFAAGIDPSHYQRPPPSSFAR